MVNNLIGKRFGKLTVIEKLDIKKFGCYLWKCRCDCNNIKNVHSTGLTSGNTKSCGCSSELDLTNKKFGRLTPIKKVGKTNRGIIWECKCDCGNIINYASTLIKTGHVRSCGCLLVKYKDRSIPAKNALYYGYKINAKNRNITFKLSFKKFLELTSKRCFYCNIEPNQIKYANTYNTSFYTYNGIDRIDSNKGYTNKNCITSCGNCNLSKLKRTQNEFYIWIKTIYKNLKNKGLINDNEDCSR